MTFSVAKELHVADRVFEAKVEIWKKIFLFLTKFEVRQNPFLKTGRKLA